jgi:hypothetical protein
MNLFSFPIIKWERDGGDICISDVILFNFNGKYAFACGLVPFNNPFLLSAPVVDLRPNFVLLYSCLSLCPDSSFFFPWQVRPWISLPRVVPWLMIFHLVAAEASFSLAMSPVVRVHSLIFPHRESSQEFWFAGSEFLVRFMLFLP